jgi:hypothetical protein
MSQVSSQKKIRWVVYVIILAVVSAVAILFGKLDLNGGGADPTATSTSTATATYTVAPSSTCTSTATLTPTATMTTTATLTPSLTATVWLDSDGDGVPDWADNCPGRGKYGKVDKNGCPVGGGGSGQPIPPTPGGWTQGP